MSVFMCAVSVNINDHYNIMLHYNYIKHLHSLFKIVRGLDSE